MTRAMSTPRVATTADPGTPAAGMAEFATCLGTLPPVSSGCTYQGVEKPRLRIHHVRLSGTPAIFCPDRSRPGGVGRGGTQTAGGLRHPPILPRAVFRGGPSRALPHQLPVPADHPRAGPHHRLSLPRHGLSLPQGQGHRLEGFLRRRPHPGRLCQPVQQQASPLAVRRPVPEGRHRGFLPGGLRPAAERRAHRPGCVDQPVHREQPRRHQHRHLRRLAAPTRLPPGRRGGPHAGNRGGGGHTLEQGGTAPSRSTTPCAAPGPFCPKP